MPLDPIFSGLASQTIGYGTPTTTFTGHIGAGTDYPVGSSVSITVSSVTVSTTVDSNGNFTAELPTSSLEAVGGPVTVTYAFAGYAASDSETEATTTFDSETDTTTTLTVDPAPLAVTAVNTSMTYGVRCRR